MRKIKIFQTFLYISLIFSINSYAQIYDRAYIENLTKEYLDSQFPAEDNKIVEISISGIDPRIEIKPCHSPLQTNIPENHNGRNVNVQISCEDSTSWSIYLSSRIQIKVPVVIALSPVDKGSTLTADNLELDYVDEHTLRGQSFQSMDDIIGAKTTRNISKGSTISPRNICLVCKGDNVTLIAKNASLMIKAAGTSLSNGKIGDKVRIKNNRSGKTVTGQVSALNEVVIIL